MWGEKSKLVENAARESLQRLGASAANKIKGTDIYRNACNETPGFSEQVSENVFKSYLSNISRDPESRIIKDTGSHGYYLKPERETTPASPQIPPGHDEKSARKSNEQLLYPVLSSWLQAKGYRAKDTSNMKSMGRWGNPDITGIMVDEALNTFDIEIVTIEAKITDENFRYDFFEAVSHKRFANRVYFAFAATANFLRENNEELRYYSELYRVGAVVIALENDHYKSYSRGELVEIDTDLVDVYELFSAPFEARLRRWQKQFLEELQISNTRELWSWGEA